MSDPTDDAIDEWLERLFLVPASAAHVRSLGPARWARARIERLLGPSPLPSERRLFVPMLSELAAHATPAERVALFLRTTAPGHDESLRFLEPLDDALVAAIDAHDPRLFGQRLDDLHPVILGLARAAAFGRSGRAVPRAWEAFFARDLTLYDRKDFALTREALRALAPERRRAIVLDALRRSQVLALFVLDVVDGDDELWRAALSLAATTEAHPHRPAASVGLARGGTAIVPALLDALAQPKPGVALEVTLLDALARIADPSSAEAMVAATGRSSAAVAAAAERGLAALGGRARPALEAGTRSKKKAVREACGRLLR